MKTAILEYRYYWSPYGDYDWRARPVKLISETDTYWRIWSFWRAPLTRVIPKNSTWEHVVS